MTDRDAMLAAIRETPDEDTPRLAFADWLDENGDPDRATFIRLQIEAVRAEPFSVPARSAAKQADLLLKKHRAEWQRDLRAAVQKQYPDHVAVQVRDTPVNSLPDVVQVQVKFERGFIGHITTQPDVFVHAADAMFAVEPIQALKLYRFSPAASQREPETHLEPVFESPHLRHLRRLEFPPMSGITEEEFAAFRDCPHLSGLRELSMPQNAILPQWLPPLLAGDRFPELQSLDFADVTHLGLGLTTAFSEWKHRDIRRLNVTNVVFTSDQLRQLLSSRCLRRAEALRIGCDSFKRTPGPLSHISPAWVIPWGQLTILDIEGQRLGNEVVGEMVRAPGTATLRSLGLAFNDLDGGIVRHVVEAKHLQLNHLDVRGNNLTPSNIAGLKKRFPDALIDV